MAKGEQYLIVSSWCNNYLPDTPCDKKLKSSHQRFSTRGYVNRWAIDWCCLTLLHMARTPKALFSVFTYILHVKSWRRWKPGKKANLYSQGICCIITITCFNCHFAVYFDNFLPALTAFILPLHQAIEKGDQSVIKRWLQNGNTKVNTCRGGRANHRHFVVADGTALHWAVYYGQLDIAKQLLSKDAGISFSTYT